MSFLYWLESIRNPVLDKIMSVITLLGDEAAFLVLALLVCIAVCCATEPGTCSDGHRLVTTESRIAD